MSGRPRRLAPVRALLILAVLVWAALAWAAMAAAQDADGGLRGQIDALATRAGFTVIGLERIGDFPLPRPRKRPACPGSR